MGLFDFFKTWGIFVNLGSRTYLLFLKLGKKYNINKYIILILFLKYYILIKYY